jgi:hypothetical protein
MSESYNFWKVNVGFLLVWLYENLSEGVNKSCLEGFKFYRDCLESSRNLFVIGLFISPPLSFIALSLAPNRKTSCNKFHRRRHPQQLLKTQSNLEGKTVAESSCPNNDYSFFPIALE